MRSLTAHLGDIRRAWRWAVVLGGAKAMVVAATIAAVALVGDQVMRGTDPAPAMWLAAVIASATCLSILISHIRQRMLERAALWVDHAIGRDLIADRLSSGAVASLATEASRHLGRLKDGLSGGAVATAADAVWLPVFAILLIMVDWRAAVIAGVVFGIGLGFAVIGASGCAVSHNDSERARAQVLADGASQNAALVRSLSLESGIVSAWAQRQGAAMSAAYSHAASIGRWHLAGQFFACVALLCAGGIALIGSQDGAIGRLDAALCIGAIAWIAWGLKDAIAAAPSLRGARHSWTCLIAASRVAARTAHGSEAGMIRLDSASFVYPGRRFVAVDQSHLTLQAGEAVALVGPAGAGKSTLAQLAAGALTPTSGSALSGGLRVGYVPELPVLMDGTVGQNIARFSLGDAASFGAAADRIGMREIIDALDAGVDTMIKTSALQPMGGLTLREARAVMFVRAVHAPIDVLVVDKPELGLDARDVHQLVAALHRIREVGVGLLIASNDPRFQALADRFVHIDAGHVVGASVNPQRRQGATSVRMVRGQHYAMAR